MQSAGIQTPRLGVGGTGRCEPMSGRRRPLAGRLMAADPCLAAAGGLAAGRGLAAAGGLATGSL